MGLALTKLSRRSVVLVLVLASAPTKASATPCPPTHILSVSPEGTVESAVARGMLEQGAKSEGSVAHVASQGLKPANHLSPELASSLCDDGRAPVREPILALAAAEAVRADIVVTFDDAAAFPRLSKARAWRTPSWNSGYAHPKADRSMRLALVAERRSCKGGCR